MENCPIIAPNERELKYRIKSDIINIVDIAMEAFDENQDVVILSIIHKNPDKTYTINTTAFTNIDDLKICGSPIKQITINQNQ